jgi:alkylhydroperoxidase family enzyme
MKALPRSDWDASLQHVIADMNDQPLNVHGLMANHPPLLAAWWPLRNYLVRGGDLEQRHCELVILRVAVHMRCWYEWASHVDRGQSAGLSVDEIEAVRLGDFDAFPVAENRLLSAVDELLQDNGLGDATLAELGPDFTPRQIMDLVALCGMYVTLGNMINTWGIDLDDPVRRRLPPGVTEESFAD